MMLRHSALRKRGCVEKAITEVLAQSKIRTPDIGGKASTEELGTAIAAWVNRTE